MFTVKTGTTFSNKCLITEKKPRLRLFIRRGRMNGEITVSFSFSSWRLYNAQAYEIEEKSQEAFITLTYF